MRVVDAKGAHAFADPEHYRIAKLCPQSRPIRVVEIDIDDVLVFLGRVLGIFDRAVGAETEPFGMLVHPGMVWGALDCEIERHLNAERCSGADKAAKIRNRAELGI